VVSGWFHTPRYAREGRASLTWIKLSGCYAGQTLSPSFPSHRLIAHLKISRGRLAFILGALAMLGPFSIDTVFPAFAVMEAELHVGKVAMQQTISVYLLGYAAMSLVHGPLSDALGRRPVILVGVAVFALA